MEHKPCPGTAMPSRRWLARSGGPRLASPCLHVPEPGLRAAPGPALAFGFTFGRPWGRDW
jgi:hypothetical protein